MIDISEARKYFPVTKNIIYLDHAAVAPIHLFTQKALEDYLSHFLKQGIKDYSIWYEKTEQIRENFADFLGADADEIGFIKSTSAGLSIFANGIEYKEGDNVVIPDIEFPANIYPWLNLKKKGVNVKFLHSEKGYTDLNRLDELIDSRTRVVSVSWIEFLNGYRNDLSAISALCREKSKQFGRKIYFCVDAIQGLGALKIDLKETEIDFLAADGHKWLLGLEGAGILYCNKKILKEVHPAFVGWKSVKNPLNFTNIDFDLLETSKKFEEGSLNVAGILSMGASLDLINKFGIENTEKRVLSLIKTAQSLLLNKNAILESCLEEPFRSGILSFSTKNIESDYAKLIKNNIQLSMRGGLLRISPHFYNTEEELEKVADIL